MVFYVQLSKGNIAVLPLVFAFFLVCIMVAVSIVDFKFLLITTTLVFVASLVALFYNYFILSSGDFVGYVFSAFAASLAFAIIVLVTKGKGMGVGDVILAFLISIVLGPVSTGWRYFAPFSVVLWLQLGFWFWVKENLVRQFHLALFWF